MAGSENWENNMYANEYRLVGKFVAHYTLRSDNQILFMKIALPARLNLSVNAFFLKLLELEMAF